MTTVVTCGDTFTGPVDLLSDLLCDGEATVDAITMDGVEAVLDCNDFSLLRSVGQGDFANGIRLINGATAKNVRAASSKVIKVDNPRNLFSQPFYCFLTVTAAVQRCWFWHRSYHGQWRQCSPCLQYFQVL
jgi:hypothetical protein